MASSASLKGANPSIVKRALSAHSAIGVTLSAFLFIICLSGIFMVFEDELRIWEQKGEPRVEALTPAGVQKIANRALARDKNTGSLILYLPTPEVARARVVTGEKAHYANAEGELVVEAHYPWQDFLLYLHYFLHLPTTFGMLIVSALGVFLFSMSITGVLAHRNIFKEAFTFRLSVTEHLEKADLHNRLSVWTAPFHIAISLTGAIIGLAALISLGVGALKYNGDSDRVMRNIYGAKPAAGSTPAPMGNIDKSLIYMKEHYPNFPPNIIIVYEPGTENQQIQIYAQHTRRLIYAERYNFDGAGNFIETVGNADGYWGQQVYDSMYKIHFGSFGGLIIKIIYGVLGTALLIIIAAGMNVYFLKRRNKGYPLIRLERAWKGVVYGSPFLLLTTYILAIIFSAVTFPFTVIFWGGLALIVAVQYGRKLEY